MNEITFWIWLSVWPALGVWEVVTIVQRVRGTGARTISMVAKERGPHVLFAIYLWSSQPTHWWWNAPQWGPDWLAWIFWAIPVALLGWDVACWREDAAAWPTWKRRARHPLTWLVVGALAGRFLFPQAGGLPLVRILMEDEPRRSPATGLRAVASLAGSVLYGRRPEDAKARRRATMGGIAMALLGIVGGVVVRGEARTDRMLAEQREDLRAAVTATRDLAEAVQSLAMEARETRTTLLEKIPDATPAPRPAPVKPLSARRSR